MSQIIPLSKMPVLAPWQKTEHHLLFKEPTRILNFFGLPAGVRIDSVKIGYLAYVETGALGKIILPNQPAVVTLENYSPHPVSLANAAAEVESMAALPTPEGAPSANANQKGPEEPKPKDGRALAVFDLFFAGGLARVTFLSPPELTTFEEIWTRSADLAVVTVQGTRYEGRALEDWRSRVLSPSIPIELELSPNARGNGPPRAVARMERLQFPKTKSRRRS